MLFIKMKLWEKFSIIFYISNSDSFLLTIFIDIAFVFAIFLIFIYVLQALLYGSKFSLQEELSVGSVSDSD